MSRFRSKWEWGWKTPLLLDPLSCAHASDPELLSLAPSLLAKLLPTDYLERFPFAEADLALSDKLSALRTSRVGVRFERVQETLFQFHPETLELRSGIQTARTEVDLLQRIEPDLLIHWEVAVKFYLALDPGGSTDPDRYIGPTLKDCLGLKLRAIRERQLRALMEPSDRHAAGLNSQDRVLAFPKVHGVLFLPYRPAEIRSDPPGTTATGLRGIYLTTELFPHYLAELSARGGKIRALRERNQWIQDQRLVYDIVDELPNALTAEKHSSEVETSQEPRQFSIFVDEKPETRFFLVPNSWPAKAEVALETLRKRSRIKA